MHAPPASDAIRHAARRPVRFEVLGLIVFAPFRIRGGSAKARPRRVPRRPLRARGQGARPPPEGQRGRSRLAEGADATIIANADGANEPRALTRGARSARA